MQITKQSKNSYCCMSKQKCFFCNLNDIKRHYMTFSRIGTNPNLIISKQTWSHLDLDRNAVKDNESQQTNEMNERNRASCLGIHLNGLQAMKWFQKMPYDLNQKRYSIKLSLFYCHMPRVEGIQQTPPSAFIRTWWKVPEHKFPDFQDLV